MREHTITKMRSLLASQDSDVLSALKAKEQSKFRDLHEVRKQLTRARKGMKRLFTRTDVKDAAVRAGVKDRGELAALQDLLTQHPEAVLNSVFWKTMGRGAASAFLYGKADFSYKPGEVGGPLSREASSFERIGGKVGTHAYKAGRTLQKAEKWFHVKDKDAERHYTRGSAFGQRAGGVDACIKKRISIRNGPDAYVGHEMGTPEYERCINNQPEREELNRLTGNSKHYQHLPAVLKELGVDPERYMKTRRDEFTYKRGKLRSKISKFLKGRSRT